MGRRKKGQKIDGWINLDKPLGLTSTQAVGRVRRFFDAQKVGHAGTLDPLATGILPIALGEATKTIPYIQDELKVYEFTVRWGQSRTTDDEEGEVLETSDYRPHAEEIKALLPNYIGDIEQMPPQFSALKIEGKRAYDLAREGQKVELKPRLVYIEELDLLDTSTDEAHFRMLCGKGTYVRALARDLGQDLGCFGYVKTLRRTEVGPFTQENAISLDILEEISQSPAPDAGLHEKLLPVEAALDDIPALLLRQEEAARLKNGQALLFAARPDYERLVMIGADNEEDTPEILAMFNDQPVAILERHKAELRPVRVFNL